jgi:hypothetical protein
VLQAGAAYGRCQSGILGNRGVEPERVFETLARYARGPEIADRIVPHRAA